MEIKHFELFLRDLTFYLQHVQKSVFYVILQTWRTEYIRDRRLKGYWVLSAAYFILVSIFQILFGFKP